MLLILDFGSQYTQLIARRVRENRVYCEVHPCHLPLAEIAAMQPKAIVLSGGPDSVFDPKAPQMDPGVLGLGVPVLGICYGLQLIAHYLGGTGGEGEPGANTAAPRSRSTRAARSSPGSPTASWSG